MVKVKKELKFLKQEQDKVTSGLMNDDRITKLQDQIQWFKEESCKLNTILEEQKRTIEKQKNHGRESKQNIEFLEKSLKESMKQNKLLKVAAERQKLQNNNLKAFLARNSVSTAIKSTDTTVKAAVNSQLVLSENLEKDVLSHDGAKLTGKHSVAASMKDEDNNKFSLQFTKSELENTVDYSAVGITSGHMPQLTQDAANNAFSTDKEQVNIRIREKKFRDYTD